ncbi:MAG: patatin-like phospholipase RssA [Burkholderiales bacterium]
MNDRHGLRVGLALGSGSARGWAHIGVIHALREAGIRPDIVCGTSIGALVAAAYATEQLDPLEEWVCKLTWQDVVGFLDLSLDGGLIKGQKLFNHFRESFSDSKIEELNIPFAAVATDLRSGREIWIQDGSVLDAVRASIALPGLFTPVKRDDRFVVDGGLVNPVPVSLARAMGANIVIGVDLNADLLGRHPKREIALSKPSDDAEPSFLVKLQSGITSLFSSSSDAKERDEMPSMLDVLAASINIMQVRVTRSRLAGEPADVLIKPKLAKLALMDFHRAAEAIEEGRKAAEDEIADLEALLDTESGR